MTKAQTARKPRPVTRLPKQPAQLVHVSPGAEAALQHGVQRALELLKHGDSQRALFALDTCVYVAEVWDARE